MLAVVTGAGLFGLRITITVIRLGLRIARIALKAIIAVFLLSMFVVFSMSRMIGT